MEIWKDIKSYEGLYKVSNLGRVKSLNYGRTGKEQILSLVLQNSGYLQVGLCKNGKVKKFKVHRLVAQAFIDNSDNLPQVNHIDQNKLNNQAINLEWCDNQYNTRYSFAKKIGSFKDGKLIKVYEAIQDVKTGGFNVGNVWSALNGRYKSSGGFQWNYLE